MTGADAWAQLAAAWRDTSAVELCAAVLAIVYLLLAVAQRIECWSAAFASSCLYVWVLFGARLYMESALNAFYAAMAVYGFCQWRGGGGTARPVSRWPIGRQLAALLGIGLLSSASWYFLRRYTPSPWPFADSMAAWCSVFATYLVAKKIYENWHWWLIIDSVCLCLYAMRRLYVTAVLFALYLVLIVVGMRQWRRSLPAHAAS